MNNSRSRVGRNEKYSSFKLLFRISKVSSHISPTSFLFFFSCIDSQHDSRYVIANKQVKREARRNDEARWKHGNGFLPVGVASIHWPFNNVSWSCRQPVCCSTCCTNIYDDLCNLESKSQRRPINANSNNQQKLY